jgi:Xaa-Pro aminopeptidase
LASPAARRGKKSAAAEQEVYPQRRDRLARLLRQVPIDALVVSDRANVRYLTGFRGEDSWLIVGRRTSFLISDARFTDQIAEECPGLEGVIRQPGSGKTLLSLTAEQLGSLRAKRVGFEKRVLSFADAEDLRGLLGTAELVPTENLVEEGRAIKDRFELQTLRESISIAERAFTVLRASLRGEDREKDLADRLEGTIRSLGGECSAFPPICAVGPRAALPHAIPGPTRVAENPLLLVDWGARFGSYNSDLTRVLATGPASSRFEKVYGTVLSAQKRAIDAIRPGALAGEIDRIARRTIEEAGFGRYFGHSLGHGLGLKVHEAPGLRQGSDVRLVPGMVVTVEPGIYLKDWGGIRIEDDVLVTKSGHEVLTSVPKEFDDIHVGISG